MEVFQLFASCIPIKGHNRSVIYDVYRQESHFIPNALYDILIAYPCHNIQQVLTAFTEEEQVFVQSYFDFLLENELGFVCDNPECFPKLDLSWEYPAFITNTIINVSFESDVYEESFFNQLDQLGCKALQIRVNGKPTGKQLESFLQKTKLTRLTSIDLLINHPQNISEQDIIELYNNHMRLSLIIVCSAKETKSLYDKDEELLPIHYATKTFNKACEDTKVTPDNLSVSIPFFTESQHHHTYFNRKLSIDVNGDIKNCPSLSQSFGNIKDTTLEEAINKPGFKALWNITKDQTHICRDCEFRHMCVDSREPFLGEDGLYDHKTPCNYDPYTATWKEDKNTKK